MRAFIIEGMTCAHCERAVAEAVHEVDPRATVDVDLTGGTMRTDSQASVEALTQAISVAGYRATAA